MGDVMFLSLILRNYYSKKTYVSDFINKGIRLRIALSIGKFHIIVNLMFCNLKVTKVTFDILRYFYCASSLVSNFSNIDKIFDKYVWN